MLMQYVPMASLSFDGKVYVADADGIVNVPPEAFDILLSHGLCAAEEKETGPKKRK